MHDAIIEIEVTAARTTAPAGTLIADGDLTHGESVNDRPVSYTFMNESAGRFTMSIEITTTGGGSVTTPANTADAVRMSVADATNNAK